jgi:hypothetical protein
MKRVENGNKKGLPREEGLLVRRVLVLRGEASFEYGSALRGVRGADEIDGEASHDLLLVRGRECNRIPGDRVKGFL